MARSYHWQNRIRFVDTDASQRIHYTAMFRHFEAAEQEFLRSMGCPYSSPDFRDYSFPRVHVECDFTAEIRYDDIIEIARDPATFCSTQGNRPNLPPDPSMIHQDGDSHSKQRGLVAKGFTPRAMREIELEHGHLVGWPTEGALR